MASAKLTDKQKRFVEEYIIDLNAKQAAIRAGYSEKRAGEIGYQLLQKTTVENAIKLAMDSREKRTNISADRVLLEIARLAFNDPRAIFDKNGALLPIKKWSDQSAAAISSVKVTALIQDGEKIGETQEIKFWDKNRSLDMAAKHLGLNAPQKTEESGTITVKIINFPDD